MKDTIMVQRANVILDISPDQKDYYMSQGFAVIDEDGKIVEETKAVTVDALNRKVAELTKELEKKDAEIAKLKSGNGGGRGRKSKEE